MSLRQAWYVGCDVCGDPEEVSTDSAAEARAIARLSGWRRVKVDGRLRDICPRHNDLSGESLVAAVGSWASL